MSIVLLIAMVETAHAESPGKLVTEPIKVEINRKGLFQAIGIAQIDSLDVGENSTVHLLLKNNTGVDLSLGTPSTTCGCVRAECDSEKLLNGKTCKLKLQLKPDRNYSDSIWYQSISFDPDKGADVPPMTVSVTIQAGLAGVFTATPSRVLFVALDEADAEDSSSVLSKDISVTVTEPIKIGNLKVGGSQLINMLDVTITDSESDAGKGKVSLKIPSGDIPVDGRHGSLTLTDPQSGQSRVIAFSMIRRKPIRVVPSTLMVQVTRQDDSGLAYGMLLREGEIEVQDQNELPPVVTAKVAGVSIPVKILSGSVRLYRFRLEFSEDQIRELSAENTDVDCQFDVLWGASRTSCTASVQFPNR